MICVNENNEKGTFKVLFVACSFVDCFIEKRTTHGSVTAALSANLVENLRERYLIICQS